MPRETLHRSVTEAFPSLTMAQKSDNDDAYLYEQLAGRSGNWELTQKPRPFHNPGKILAGVFFNVMCWAGLGCIAYCGFKYYKTDDRQWMVYALGGLITFLIFQVAAYSNGLHTTCPLCHGTPLHEKRCRKHRFANKFLFFSHKVSTVLSILTRGRFNCMYCGTPFRLKK
jgi:hypothetical protein